MAMLPGDASGAIALHAVATFPTLDEVLSDEKPL